MARVARARATAGEFGLNFGCVSAPKLLTRWTGATGENIQSVFAQAAARRPVLFFIEEIDAVGAVRQDAISDAGGAGRELNNIMSSLMSAIDQYCSIDGFILMSATDRLDGFDKALIREGRFDAKIRLDLRDDLVIPEPIQRDLQSIIRLLEDPARTRFLGLEVPTGLLLVGHREPGRLLLPV